jgi:hypothetical protein
VSLCPNILPRYYFADQLPSAGVALHNGPAEEQLGVGRLSVSWIIAYGDTDRDDPAEYVLVRHTPEEKNLLSKNPSPAPASSFIACSAPFRAGLLTAKI